MIKEIDDLNKNDVKVKVYCDKCGNIINSSILMNYHDGECSDYFWMKAYNCKTKEEYISKSKQLVKCFENLYKEPTKDKL